MITLVYETIRPQAGYRPPKCAPIRPTIRYRRVLVSGDCRPYIQAEPAYIRLDRPKDAIYRTARLVTDADKKARWFLAILPQLDELRSDAAGGCWALKLFEADYFLPKFAGKWGDWAETSRELRGHCPLPGAL